MHKIAQNFALFYLKWLTRELFQYKTVNTNELRRILTEQRKRLGTEDEDVKDAKNVEEEFSFLQDQHDGIGELWCSVRGCESYTTP